MSIVSSVIAHTAPQVDGRRWVHEVHTDHLGLMWTRDWLAQAADDLNAALAAYAIRLAADMGSTEAQANVERMKADGSLASVTTVYCTLTAIRTALRSAYQNVTRQEAIMLADFVSTLSDAQLQALFGLTAGQVTTLRSNKLTPAVTLATNIRAAAGA